MPHTSGVTGTPFCASKTPNHEKRKERTMSRARAGDTVQVHYTGRFADGSVIDSSVKRDPLEATLGEGQLIPGVEEAVVGMQPGEVKTAKIPPDKGYGERREDLLLEFDRGKVPPEVEVQVGKRLSVETKSGQRLSAEVTNIIDDVIKLDANHPLAGKELTFDIQLVAITAEG
jgi:FKBP-type peptidyl-prolyl cis-trans isomerase 2